MFCSEDGKIIDDSNDNAKERNFFDKNNWQC